MKDIVSVVEFVKYILELGVGVGGGRRFFRGFFLRFV